MSDSARILSSLPKMASAQPESRPFQPVCALFRRFLHEKRLKFTPERAMILDAALRQNGLFEAEQLVSEVQRLGHRVSRATVYRTLTHLQEAGICKVVTLSPKQSHFEVIAGRNTYDYLICAVTGRVIEVDAEKMRRLRDEICREHGFAPLSHQFHIFGISPEAQSASKDRPTQDSDSRK